MTCSSTTVFVASSRRDDLVVAWNAVASGFGDHDPPSTLIGVTVSRLPGSVSRNRGDCLRTSRTRGLTGAPRVRADSKPRTDYNEDSPER